GGKTTVFYGILLILGHLKKSPIHELGCFKFPNNPVIMIVMPLNELGNMHAAEMTAMGLKAVAINSETITAALDENRDLLDESRMPYVKAWACTVATSTSQGFCASDPISVLFLVGDRFPNIAWVLDDGKKVVVYCKTIELVFCVALYLWSQCPPGPERMKIVWVWYSLTCSKYNNKMLDLFTNHPGTKVIIATITFGMGMNLKNISEVINLGMPYSLSSDIQQKGWAGRDLKTAAVGYTYVEGSKVNVIRQALTASKQQSTRSMEVQDQPH
ncbi:hypothetical protein PAXRUDRAFT_29197, partial [Paxillus rubicundulus Ve08.2h10]